MSNDGPDLAATRAPAMTWYQHGSDDFIRWSPSARAVGPALRWPAPVVLNDRRTSHVPSISGSTYGSCMVWKGSGADRRIWFSLLDQPLPNPLPGEVGHTWGPQAQAALFEAAAFPTAVRYRGRTFMFYKATAEYNYHIRWSELRGREWVHPITGTSEPAAATLDWVRTDDGVAVVENVHNGELVMAWRDAGGDKIRWAVFDGHLWTEPRVVPGAQASKTPTLACDGTLVHLAWRNASDDHISWTRQLGSTWWPPQVLDDRRTAGGPALGATEGTGGLVMTWVGGTGDVRIWWSQYDNDHWGPQQAFTDRQMNIDLRASLA
ncbi:hypothetical protein [Saccharothrix stipae]